MAGMLDLKALKNTIISVGEVFHSVALGERDGDE